MYPKLYRVKTNKRESPGVFTLELLPKEGTELMRFRPGQFNMLYVFGAGEVPISHCGDPYRTDALVHTIRTVGAITRRLQEVAQGETIGVRGPFGSYWPIEEARGKDVLMIAGGLGLPPLMPVAHTLQARRAEYRRIALLYGTRTPNDLIFTRDLFRLRDDHGFQLGITVDAGNEDWTGDVGVVSELLRKTPYDPRHCIAMICGPEVMMRFAIGELRRSGVPDASIYLSMERNMKCAIGLCGHCQYREKFICKDGPVFNYTMIRDHLGEREL